jgi:hypothetical protein
VLCSVKGSVLDLSEIFIPKIEGIFHTTTVRVSGTNTIKPNPNRRLHG